MIAHPWFFNISIIGMLQGLFLAFLFFKKGSQHQAHYYLSFFLLLFSLGLIEPFIENWQHPISIYLQTFIGNSTWLYGPIIYFFAKSITQDQKLIDFSKHTIPFVLFLLLDSSLFFSFGEDLMDLLNLIIYEGFMLQILWYSIAAIKQVKKYLILEKDIIANEKNSLRWLSQLLILLLFTYLFSFVIIHLLIFEVLTIPTLYLYVQIPSALVLYWLSYKAINESASLFLIKKHIDNVSKKLVTELEKSDLKVAYEKSGLTKEKAQLVAQQLRTLMEQQKPYLNSNLTITDLSEALQISRNHLTQVINQIYGKNFHRFVNEYRVQAAQKLLMDVRYKNYTLSAIGLEAGFNSKTAFNNNFKKITNMTPTQWRKNSTNSEGDMSVVVPT